MTASFAEIETAVAIATVAALANAEATLPNGNTVLGIFDASPIDSLGIAGNEPEFLSATSLVSSVVYGSQITLNAITYSVRVIRTDGTGMTRLVLEVS